MTPVFKILEMVGEAKGKEKGRILAANKNNEDLQMILDITFNFNRRYYIKKWNFSSAQAQGVNGIAVEEFNIILSALEGGLRGKEAAALVERTLSGCTVVQAEWYARALKRDLKIGVGIDTALAAGFDIPNFEVQLAKDYNKCKRISSYYHEAVPSFASTKLDGYRCFTVIQGGDVMLLTRNGNIFNNFPQIEEGLSKAFPKGNWCFDGEIMSDDFSSMQQSAFAESRGTTVGDVKYYIFDCIPFSEWKSKEYESPASLRYEMLLHSFDALKKDPRFKMVEHISIHSEKEFMGFYEKCLEGGLEGAMLNPDIPYYEGKVSNRMLKFKPNEDWDCKVLGVYPGEKGTKYENSLGGLIVLQENKIKGKVGGGFSDLEREQIWADPKSVIGRTIKVRFQNLTPDKQMRHPRKIEFRMDKGG